MPAEAVLPHLEAVCAETLSSRVCSPHWACPRTRAFKNVSLRHVQSTFQHSSDH